MMTHDVSHTVLLQRMLRRTAMFSAALALIAGAPRAASAIDWIVAPSYFTHDPESGQRVTQYTPIGPVYAAYDPTYVKSGFRHSRSSLQVRGFADHLFVVEEYGRPVRPFGEWNFPYRPYSVPYSLWGPPYAFYGYGGYPYGGSPYGGYGDGGFGPGYPGYGSGGFGGGPHDFEGGYGSGFPGHGKPGSHGDHPSGGKYGDKGAHGDQGGHGGKGGHGHGGGKSKDY